MAQTDITRFPVEALDFELLRRRAYPPTTLSLPGLRKVLQEERTTFAALYEELTHTPLDHPDRAWREWECALALRQYILQPDQPFCRVVEIAST